MTIHELSDLDADALTITTRGTHTWVTCTSEGEEVTVGPFPTQKLTSALPRHSDDMDGGVTAALIEKEARSGASLAAHFRDKRDMERARAEKAEDRADEAHNVIVSLRADLAATEARAEQAEKERDEALAFMVEAQEEATRQATRADTAEPRPLMPEVTGEMVERALRAWRSRSGAARVPDTVRDMLTAALTPSARPEGAEGLDGHLDASLRGVGLHPLTAEELRTVADNLASEGVRTTVADPESLAGDLAAHADTMLPHTDQARADWLIGRGWRKADQ